MLGLFRKKKSKGIPDIESLRVIPAKVLEFTQKNDPESILGQLSCDERFRTAWFKQIQLELDALSQIQDEQSLLLILRDKTLKAIEESMLYRQILSDELTDEGVAIWATEVIGESEVKKANQICMVNTAHQDANVKCFRKIAWDLGDAHNGDWFSKYAEFYSEFVDALCKATIDHYREEPDGMGAVLMAGWNAKRDELRAVILAGYQIEKEELGALRS